MNPGRPVSSEYVRSGRFDHRWVLGSLRRPASAKPLYSRKARSALNSKRRPTRRSSSGRPSNIHTNLRRVTTPCTRPRMRYAWARATSLRSAAACTTKDLRVQSPGFRRTPIMTAHVDPKGGRRVEPICGQGEMPVPSRCLISNHS
jgi:hypothetical protein